MRTVEEIQKIIESPYKIVEKELGIQIRNGQSIEGVRKALEWVMTESFELNMK